MTSKIYPTQEVKINVLIFVTQFVFTRTLVPVSNKINPRRRIIIISMKFVRARGIIGIVKFSKQVNNKNSVNPA